MIRSTCLSVCSMLIALGASGCDEKPAPGLAPTSSALAPAKPATAASKAFVVDKPSSKIDFTMDAPQEKIHGRVNGATEGTLSVDLMDVTKTTGLIVVDITGIELYQSVVDKDGKAGEEKKSDLQNQHARTWLQISDDAPEEERKKNSKVEFSIQSVEGASTKDVTKMSGAERKVKFKATGDFRLHGRKSTQTTELEATFTFDGDKPAAVSIVTLKPLAVDLAAHEVQPRETFGKLAQKTLSALSPKVAKEALVSIEFKAKVGEPAAAPSAAPATSAAP